MVQARNFKHNPETSPDLQALIREPLRLTLRISASLNLKDPNTSSGKDCFQ